MLAKVRFGLITKQMYSSDGSLHVDRQRPNLEAYATNGERHAPDADPSIQLHQEMIRCMQQLCSSHHDGWFDVLVNTIKPRLSPDVPWQVRYICMMASYSGFLLVDHHHDATFMPK